MAVTVRNSAVVAVIVAAIITAALAYYIAMSKHPEICMRKECVNAASRILDTMDSTSDPCNDFYQYACGGWLRNNEIPDGEARRGQFDLVEERNSKALKGILNSDYSTDRDSIKKAKIFYRSCMDEESIEELGARPALDLISSNRGMPLFGDKFNEKTFDLADHLALVKYRVGEFYLQISSPLITMAVIPDEKIAKRRTILLDQPFLGLPDRDYYLDEELREASLPKYRKFMQDYLKALWQSRDEARNETTFNEAELNESVDEMVQLETELAEILQPTEERMNPRELYNKISLQDMAVNISSGFNWFKFVREVMKKVNINITPTTEVVSYGTVYFKKMMDVLMKYEKRVIKNYIMWMNLQQHVSMLSKKFRDTQAPLRIAISGTAEERKRFLTCIDIANELFPMPVGALFVKAKFSEDSKAKVKDMIVNVIEAFKETLPTLDWMDEETKKKAMVKADNVIGLIGYPDYILDAKDPKLDVDYKDAVVEEDKFFEGFYSSSQARMRFNLGRLEEPTRRDDFGIGPAVVNAYYDPTRNAMIFIAALLQYPFYDVGFPPAMNYGAIGMVVGHELTHGFDNQGSQYNEVGVLENWWGNTSDANFKERANCFRKQYGSFFYKAAGQYVNGNTTIGENIADNGGIRQCFDAYKIWKKNNARTEFTLPGLEEFTQTQLMFIGNAQFWCNKERPEYAKKRITTAFHSPGQFRVEGPFMNFEEFGKAFNCKQGEDRLYPNPEDTCRIW